MRLLSGFVSACVCELAVRWRRNKLALRVRFGVAEADCHSIGEALRILDPRWTGPLESFV